MGSIRAKLAALTGAAAALAVLAALSVLVATGAMDRALEAAVGAQQRLDRLTELSARFSEFGLAAVSDANHPVADRDLIAAARARVLLALDAVSALAAQGMPPPDDDASPAQAQGRGRLIAHLRADFALLDRQITEALAGADIARRADTVRGALNGFAAGAGPILSILVETDRRQVVSAREEAQALSERLKAGAVVLAVLVLAAAVVLYRAVTRPLLGRLAEIDRAAAAIGHGALDTRLSIGPRDELGILMARFNRMAARLARREKRVVEDRAMLERTVAERTADLTEANARLAAIDASRRRFFADVSHELRTPLTVIIGECDVTTRAPAISDALSRSVLATIRKRAGLMHRRVEDLLRIARSESGQIELVFQDVPLRPLLCEAAASFKVAAARRGIALAVDAAEPSPLVHADRDWLRQVIEGLIDNALRHGGTVHRITVAHASVTDAVGQAQERITVVDDGAGIPAAERDRLFARFARREGIAGSSGFGLGLALAEWVVTQHAGRITLEANQQEGGGTCVVILLPALDGGREAGEETP